MSSILSYRIVNEEQINEHDWESYVDQHRAGTIFHTPGMFKIHASTSQYEPYAFFALDSQGRICAMVQGFIQTIIPGLGAFLTRRSVMLQSPLYSTIAALSSLVDGYIQFTKQKAVFTEIRNHIISPESKQFYETKGFEFADHLNFIVNCTEPETTWKNISESKRRQIKKAFKNGVHVVEHPAEDQVKSFYQILRKMYSEKVGKPLAPYEYFQQLYKLRTGDYNCKFLLVEHQSIIIGGMVALISGKRVIHEHFVAGMDSEYKDQYPSVVATWAAIDYACRNDISEFDFMGAGKPDVDYGVREFKARFGGDLVHPGRFQLIHSQLKYKIAEQGFHLYQKIKLSL